MNITQTIRSTATAFALASGFLLAAHAQFPTQQPQSPNSQMGTHKSGSDSDIDARMSAGSKEKMAIARNDDRQKRLVADTDKLVALVTQLKTDVDKTDKYMLSLDVVRRSEEIEKLARSIKERAKN
ncbi:hypothetical protein [Granulicella tundricola]|uniref:Uncharacterized protein n=1 Tax=Granulicella tundricola (strain ATCC BAA-1859 / DSM 23138 / MP5ACTX9) TaxID=1198114 RepID=E8WYA3_GRATM|nr:hypothetical protein [Granulicella tundricola]ADW68730.1 hypothetical protein AciX9_1680 [Granulicella tundricola MP5ACTX9]